MRELIAAVRRKMRKEGLARRFIRKPSPFRSLMGSLECFAYTSLQIASRLRVDPQISPQTCTEYLLVPTRRFRRGHGVKDCCRRHLVS